MTPNFVDSLKAEASIFHAKESACENFDFGNNLADVFVDAPTWERWEHGVKKLWYSNYLLKVLKHASITPVWSIACVREGFMICLLLWGHDNTSMRLCCNGNQDVKQCPRVFTAALDCDQKKKKNSVDNIVMLLQLSLSFTNVFLYRLVASGCIVWPRSRHLQHPEVNINRDPRMYRLLAETLGWISSSKDIVYELVSGAFNAASAVF